MVITPDTAFDIPWRGALVYVNDREGKITKINLTDMDKEGVSMFDQTTLFTLNANSDNRRYTFSRWMQELDFQLDIYGYLAELEILMHWVNVRFNG